MLTELFYADDLLLMAQSESELKYKQLINWKKGVETKGLEVNDNTTKVIWTGVTYRKRLLQDIYVQTSWKKCYIVCHARNGHDDAVVSKEVLTW